MSFGKFPCTSFPSGQSFAERYPASVFEALPAPAALTSEAQFERAQQIEAAYVVNERGECSWAPGAKRYLFFMLNEAPDANCDTENLCLGGFYDSPQTVRDSCFIEPLYPASFRWFVIDPTEREEVAFIASQMEDFWWFENWHKPTAHEWWFAALHAAYISAHPNPSQYLDGEHTGVNSQRVFSED